MNTIHWILLLSTSIALQGGCQEQQKDWFLFGNRSVDQMLPELEKSDISSLRLENAELTERHIEIVSGMKSLKVLHFSNDDFPDSGLGRLKELKQLESLIIEPSLNPDRNTEDFLTDRDLDFLMDLRNLKQVRLVSKGGVTRFELATSTSRT